jgi:nucleoid-associated protein YgaU
MSNFKNLLLLLFTVAFTACSSGDKLKREDNQIAVFEDGLYLSEPDEDGVVELVIPEVEEYTEIKNDAEERANQGSLDFGTSTDIAMEAASVQRSIASIGTEEADDFIAQEEEMYKDDPVVAEENMYQDDPVVAEENMYADESQNNNFQTGSQTDGEIFQEYIVQKNDSLMLISFKLYSRFDNWKTLADWNGIDSQSDYLITEGDKLKFKVSAADGTNWVPSGNPYLVKVGDYLGLISKNVYEGNARFWYDIWKNNDTLIKDPNRVFVGFTLYTEPFEVVQENERLRMEEYKRKFGKTIRKRDLAGALESSNRL